MKVYLNLVIFIVIIIINLLTIHYLNKIVEIRNIKAKNFSDSIKFISKNEEIQKLKLSEFLSLYKPERFYTTKEATLYIYKIDNIEMIYQQKNKIP